MHHNNFCLKHEAEHFIFYYINLFLGSNLLGGSGGGLFSSGLGGSSLGLGGRGSLLVSNSGLGSAGAGRKLGLGGLSLFLSQLSNQLVVFGGFLLVLFVSQLLHDESSSLALDTFRSDQSLNLGGLSALGLAFLGGQFTSDNKLANVVLLLQIEELADLADSLGTQSLVHRLLSQSGNLLLTTLNDDDVDNSEIRTDDATTNRLSAASTISAFSVETRV
jgi:hypothetical protein